MRTAGFVLPAALTVSVPAAAQAPAAQGAPPTALTDTKPKAVPPAEGGVDGTVRTDGEPNVTDPAEKKASGRFTFGSYGRVVASSDLRGGSGRNADVVAHGPRIDEGTYTELELARTDEWAPGITTAVVTTLAIADPIFHFDGRFDAKIALRNLYIEERGIGDRGLSFWAGSRMYRGDDIYLLDFWPLDNLNTVGGGIRFDTPDDRTFAAWHFGLNRVDDELQVQTVERPAAQNQPGVANVTLLDRPRVISSLKLGHILPVIGEKGGLKGVLYGEVHQLPSGEREERPGVIEDVQGDSGAVIGGQIGVFTGERDGFLNLFIRHATGLAAFGEFGTPVPTSPEETASGARETLVGLSGNYEHDFLALTIGGYFRSFREPTPEPFRFGNVDEGVFVARPQLFIGERAGVAVEGSYQAQQRGVLDVSSSNVLDLDPQPLEPQVWRFGLMPFLTPAGRGAFRRPQIRLIYVYTRRNDAARSLYAQDDVFAIRRVEQFFGVGAEWWFNSTSYGN